MSNAFNFSSYSSIKICFFNFSANCLNLFLDNRDRLTQKTLYLFDLFYILSKSQLRYIDNNLEIKLTQYLYEYSLNKTILNQAIIKDTDEIKVINKKIIDFSLNSIILKVFFIIF